MRFFLLLLVLLNVGRLHALSTQNIVDTLYLDDNFNVITNRSEASVYCLIRLVNGGISNPSIAYYLSGERYWQGDLISFSENAVVTNGICTWYYKNGVKKREVAVSSNLWNGLLQGWWENGKLKERSTYVNDQKDGCEYQWDENGKCVSSRLAVISEEYSKNPGAAKYKIECQCEEDAKVVQHGDDHKIASAKSEVSSPKRSNDYTAYGTGLVREHMNDLLANQESVLLKLLESKKKNTLIYLDFNFHEANTYDQKVANSVYWGLMNTGNFERIFAAKYNEHLNENIYYTIDYKIVLVNIAEVDRTSAGSNEIAYLAELSCLVRVKDSKGTVVLSEIFEGETNKHFKGRSIGYSYRTKDEAVKHSADNLTKQITKHFEKKFSFD